MRTLFAPLFKQFALLEHPVRYFLYLFVMILGVFHFAIDIAIIFFDKTLTDVARLTVFSLILSILFFISEYFRQRKLKRISSQSIAI